MKNFTCTILVVLLLVSWGIRADAWKSSTPLQRATWLWDATLIQRESSAVLSFLRDEGIGLLYLQVDHSVPMEEYRTFINQATDQHILVYALQGEPDWVTSEGSAKSDSIMEWLHTYQQTSDQAEQFAGIHLDVEPYLLPNWNHEQKELVEEFQQLIVDWKVEALNGNLELGLDIPFWYDEIRLGNQSLAKWIIQQADTVTIMSYRDHIEGPNGVLRITQKEREYAAQIGKKLYLALETKPSSEANYISFKSYSALKQAVSELEQKASGVEGIGIHHYTSFRKLKEKMIKRENNRIR
ncbi:hypothetical protein [Brevibacillus sp. SYSU BS000544]|uniref:hypothetical protein n=1 Tax=Brevibacillus sp. SYSU BS000544 TaxID=3416443 RepID=UPI003CE49C74